MINIDLLGIEKGLLCVDVSDTYIGIYEKAGLSDSIFCIGLFKKCEILDISPRGEEKPHEIQRYHEIQTYIDVLSGSVAALCTNGNKEDIIANPKYTPEAMKPYRPISPHYKLHISGRIYNRFNIEYDYCLKPISAEIIGIGLVNYEKFAPEQKGYVPLLDVLTTLMKFNRMTVLDESWYEYIADSRRQEEILNSLILGAAYVSEHRDISNYSIFKRKFLGKERRKFRCATDLGDYFRNHSD